MSVTRRSTIAPIVVNGSSAFTLFELVSRSINPAVSLFENHAAGVPERGYVAVQSQEPVITAETMEISRFLTNVDSLVGLAIPDLGAGTVYTSVDVYDSKKVNKGTRATGGVQLKASMSSALIVPRRLSCEVNREARLTFEIHALSSDGLTAPWTYSTTGTLPSITTSNWEKFTVGPVSLNGTTIDAVQGIDIDFGMRCTARFSNSGVFPESITIDQTDPTISIRTLDVSSLNTWGISGTAQTGVAANVYFQKISGMNAGGVTRVANATAVHVLFASNASQSLITCEEFGGQNNDDSAGVIRITPIKGSAAIWTVSAASAIT